MYQKTSGQQPPKAMQSAMAAFETAQLSAVARGVANCGVMPRNLNSKQREAVLMLVRRLSPSL